MDEMTLEELTKQAVDAAKAKGNRVFKVSFEGTDTFYIRPVQRLEYKNLVTAIEAVSDARSRADLHDEKVVQMATVFPVVTPEFLSKSGAGFVTVLANEILRVSGFTNNLEVSEV